MKRSNLRKVIDILDDKKEQYYFHQWYNDFSGDTEYCGEGLSAILENEKGEIKILNYGRVQFIPDHIKNTPNQARKK